MTRTPAQQITLAFYDEFWKCTIERNAKITEYHRISNASLDRIKEYIEHSGELQSIGIFPNEVVIIYTLW